MKYAPFPSKTHMHAILVALLLVGCAGPDKTGEQAKDSGSVKDTVQGKTADVKNGLQRINTKNGGYMEGMLVDGKRSGAWVAFFPGGTIQSKANYADGIEVGPTEVYHANGNVYYSGQYVNGKPSGEWVFHGEDGIEMKRVVYDANGMAINP